MGDREGNGEREGGERGMGVRILKRTGDRERCGCSSGWEGRKRGIRWAEASTGVSAGEAERHRRVPRVSPILACTACSKKCTAAPVEEGRTWGKYGGAGDNYCY